MGHEITESKSGMEWSVGYSGDEDDALLRGDLLGPPLDGLFGSLDSDPRHRHRHLKSKVVRHSFRPFPDLLVVCHVLSSPLRGKTTQLSMD